MKKLCVVVWLVLSSINRVYAIAPACMNANGTIEINECMQDELEKVEKKLSAKYQKTLKALSVPNEVGWKYSSSKKAVMESQRAWVKFRDKDCEAEETMTNGTGTASWYIDCKINHANTRIKRLDEFDPKFQSD